MKGFKRLQGSPAFSPDNSSRGEHEFPLPSPSEPMEDGLDVEVGPEVMAESCPDLEENCNGQGGSKVPSWPYFRIPVCGRGAGWLHWLLERRFSCWMEQKRKRLSEVKWKLKKDCAVNTGGSDIWRNLNRFRVVIEQV